MLELQLTVLWLGNVVICPLISIDFTEYVKNWDSKVTSFQKMEEREYLL